MRIKIQIEGQYFSTDLDEGASSSLVRQLREFSVGFPVVSFLVQVGLGWWRLPHAEWIADQDGHGVETLHLKTWQTTFGDGGKIWIPFLMDCQDAAQNRDQRKKEVGDFCPAVKNNGLIIILSSLCSPAVTSDIFFVTKYDVRPYSDLKS